MTKSQTVNTIVANNLTRTFNGNTAVKDVSFSVTHGEIVGLLGHNGAGKTTIMKLLTGFLDPDSGDIDIDDLSMHDKRKEIQQLIGYLPEILPLYPDMSVLDYLAFTAKLRHIPQDQQISAVRGAITATGLRDRAFSLIGTLSRGYRQRVGVAQAIIHRPRILILDEPTNGLDPEQTQTMRMLILQLAKSATVILSTHIMQEVEAICDRVLIMRTGHLALDTKMVDLSESNRIYLHAETSRTALQRLLGDNVSVLPMPTREKAFWLEYKQRITKSMVAETASMLARENIALYELHPEKRSLEQVFTNISQGGGIDA